MRDRHPRQDERRKRNTVKEGEGTSSLLWRQGEGEGHTYTQKKERTKFGSSPSCGRSRRLRPSSSSSSFPSAENLGTSLFSPPAVPGQPFSPNYRSSHTHTPSDRPTLFSTEVTFRGGSVFNPRPRKFSSSLYLIYSFPPSLSLLPAS